MLIMGYALQSCSDMWKIYQFAGWLGSYCCLSPDHKLQLTYFIYVTSQVISRFDDTFVLTQGQSTLWGFHHLPDNFRRSRLIFISKLLTSQKIRVLQRLLFLREHSLSTAVIIVIASFSDIFPTVSLNC